MTDWPDIAVKAFTSIVGLSSAVWAIRQFFLQRRAHEHDMRIQEKKDHEVLVRESQKPFLERQLQYYFEITKIVSQLSTLSHGVDFDRAKQRFWEFYWGELSIVESIQVKSAMVKIGHALDALEIVSKVPHPGSISNLSPQTWQTLTFHLERTNLDILTNIKELKPAEPETTQAMYDKVEVYASDEDLSNVCDNIKRGLKNSQLFVSAGRKTITGRRLGRQST